jgi:hypothetical protein
MVDDRQLIATWQKIQNSNIHKLNTSWNEPVVKKYKNEFQEDTILYVKRSNGTEDHKKTT